VLTGVTLTLLPHLGKLLAGAPVAGQVEGSFKALSGLVVKDRFLERWFEFLSFALSGLPADGTIAAAVAYTMRDLHQRGAALDYPIGGSGAVVEALVRGALHHSHNSVPVSTAPATGVTKGGKGKVLLRSHVESIFMHRGRAEGVWLRGRGGGNKRLLRARRAVISNASIWDTTRLLPTGTLSEQRIQERMDTPRTGSFVHLHLGIDASGLPADLEYATHPI
jgi:phytoene dehydrogenase-like protein